MAVVKVIELMGVSASSWEKAALQIADEASLIVHHVHAVQITNYNAVIKNNRIVEYRVTAQLIYENENKHD